MTTYLPDQQTDYFTYLHT